jgi:hypothetical protein
MLFYTLKLTTVGQINKLIIIIVLMFIPKFGFSQSDKKDIIFDWKTKKNCLWMLIDSTFEKFTPSIEEIQLAKDISIKYIDSIEQKREPKIIKKYGKLLQYNQPDYYRQFVGYIDKNGNKIIYINACCSAFGDENDMVKDWMIVLDGGSCFYQVKIDIIKRKCIEFWVNQDA